MKVPTLTDIQTAVFARYPFHCTDCGTLCDFRNPNFEYTIPGGNRVMLHNSSFTDCLCGKCLAKRIAAWFANPTDRFGEPDAKPGICDTCKTEKVVAGSISAADFSVDCRFGSQWWNGHWICCDCLSATAINGAQNSGTMASISGEYFAINEAGARIRQKT